MEERVEQVEWEMNLWGRAVTLGPCSVEGPSTLSKYAGGGPPVPYTGLGAALAAELMIGFWFGTGVILAVKMVQSLECCIEELIRRK